MGAAIRLCGRLQVAITNEDVAERLPGRQGRLLLAYLACNRTRPVTRDELIDLLWPSDPPAAPDEVLGALLSKLRRALGAGVVEGRHELHLILPPDAATDVELAADALDEADAALARDAARVALERAQAAAAVTRQGFLPGVDNGWVQERRREVEELSLRALECVAASALALGTTELATAERAARALVGAAPLAEPGYRLLMQALARRGDVAGALQAYERLRQRLREELGIAPSAAARRLHQDLLAAGGENGVSSPAPAVPRDERKLVSVLAAELADSLPGSDPEDLLVTRGAALARLRDVVERHGGTVATTTDSPVLALFGAPVAHEDDAERAVTAALRLCELGIAVGAGVASGEVLVMAGPEGATGSSVGEAIRLGRGTPPGRVVADAMTVAATRSSVSYEGLEQDGSRLVRSAGDSLSRAVEHPVRTRFVGRGNELTLLESLHGAVVERGTPAMVSILGAPGVGKSRLVDEFLSRVSSLVYRGRCLAYGAGATYWALREILWGAAEIRFDETAATAAAKLSDLVRRVVPDSDDARVAAALAIGSGMALPENPLAGVAPASIADEMGLAWPALLTGLAARGPLVVVVEDLHWSEEPLLEMLERVLARASGSLFVVVTGRPEFGQARPRWSSAPRMAQISLQPLSQAASRELVSALLPGAALEVQERVLAAAEGNPFFAEELARHLSDDARGGAEIPNTIRTLLSARIDRLPELEKQVLQDAAVVGRTFWSTTLEAIEPQARLADALRGLEERAFVVTRPTSSLPGQRELSFWHGLTREVAYRSIPRARRCRAHAAVADWLEALAGDRREEFVDLLAHHYEAACAPADAALAWPVDSPQLERLREKAVWALIEAGDAARTRMSIDQALRFAERPQALASTERERLAVLRLEARAHHAAVHADEALAAYLAGIELAGRLGDRATLGRLRAYAILLCVRYAGAFAGKDWESDKHRLIEGGLADDNGDPESFERGAVLVGKGWGFPRWGGWPARRRASAKRELERAIAIAQAIDSSELLATALEGLTWVSSDDGFCEARAMGERLVRSSGSDRLEAHESHVTAAMFFVWAGELDRGMEIANAAAADALSMSPHRRLHSAMAQALCLISAGRFTELGQATDRVLDLAGEDASHEGTCMAATVALAGRVLWLYETGDPNAAAALELMNRIRPPDRESSIVIYDYLIAEMLRPFEGFESTRALLDRLPPREHNRASQVLYLRALLPSLVLAQAHDEAAARIAQARALARSACAPALALIADWAAAAATRTTDPAGSLERALAATTALDRYGERYTAARLLAELLPLIESTAAAALAGETASRLTAMGALTSAARARNIVSASRSLPVT